MPAHFHVRPSWPNVASRSATEPMGSERATNDNSLPSRILAGEGRIPASLRPLVLQGKRVDGQVLAPQVSIILLNWNQMEVTAACLDTLSNVEGPSFEVLVVDQASANNEGIKLARRYPWIRLLQVSKNIGFTGGNNLGIRHARGSYVLLLNNDTEVPSDFLTPLVAAFEADAKLGIASPKIRYYSDPDRIQYAGCNAMDAWTMRGHMFGYGEIDKGQHDVVRNVALAHGAAMMIRRAVLEEIGMLAEDFFIYYEEFDFCTRASRAGWLIRYIPFSLVMHKESVTVGKASPFKTEYMTRNRITYLRRNGRGLSKYFAMIYVLGLALPIHLVRHLTAKRWKHAAALLRGLRWHLTPRNVQGNVYPSSRISSDSKRSIEVAA